MVWINNEHKHENLLPESPSICLYIARSTIYAGQNKTRRAHRCQIWTWLLAGVLVHPLASHYLCTSHSCLIQNYMKITIGNQVKNNFQLLTLAIENLPLWCHEDLCMVMAHGGAVFPSKVVDVVPLLVG